MKSGDFLILSNGNGLVIIRADQVISVVPLGNAGTMIRYGTGSMQTIVRETTEQIIEEFKLLKETTPEVKP